MTVSKQKARSGKTLLLVLLGVLVAMAVGVYWMWSGRPTQPDVDAGRAVAEQFLQQIRAGKADQAWASTTAEFKSAQGRETFSKFVKDHPLLSKPTAFVAVQTVTIQDSPRAEYTYRATEGAGTVRLLAGNEQGAWRIDRIAVH